MALKVLEQPTATRDLWWSGKIMQITFKLPNSPSSQFLSTFQSSSYSKHKPFINSFQCYLFCYKFWLSYFSATEYLIYYTIWISICRTKNVQKHFEVVCFHLVYPFPLHLIACIPWMGRMECCSRFLHILR